MHRYPLSLPANSRKSRGSRSYTANRIIVASCSTIIASIRPIVDSNSFAIFVHAFLVLSRFRSPELVRCVRKERVSFRAWNSLGYGFHRGQLSTSSRHFRATIVRSIQSFVQFLRFSAKQRYARRVKIRGGNFGAERPLDVSAGRTGTPGTGPGKRSAPRDHRQPSGAELRGNQLAREPS